LVKWQKKIFLNQANYDFLCGDFVCMLSNREFTSGEISRYSVFGRIHDKSSVPEGERTGVILVHGRAGNETLMWVFSKAIQELDPIAIAPRAPEADPIGGYSWWNFENRVEGEESPAPRKTTLDDLEPGLTAVSHIAHQMVKYQGVHPSKIIGIGFSQGAALLGSLALMEPDLFSGIGMLAGFLPSSVQDFFSSQEFPRLPRLFMSHGTKDKIISFNMALRSRDYFLSKGAELHFHSDDVSHKISSGGMKELKEWVSRG
jgi:predicted esterase